jgi:single-strand DNA-binding protein
MPNFCSITVAGHLGRDPELKFLGDGKAVCNFSVAVSEKRGGNEETTWFNVSAFGKQAESCGQYLAKGRAVIAHGKIRSRKYTAKDGSEKVAWEVLADRVVFLGGGKDQPARETAATTTAAASDEFGFD